MPCLDRNGLRPSRYYVTKDDLVIMASEVGVLDVPPERVLEKRRLQPGRMFLVDTSEGRIISDEEIKQEMAAARPYRKWLKENLVRFDALPNVAGATAHTKSSSNAAAFTDFRLQLRRSPHQHWIRWHKMVFNPSAQWARTLHWRFCPIKPQLALQLFQTAFRASDQSAHRSHS